MECINNTYQVNVWMDISIQARPVKQQSLEREILYFVIFISGLPTMNGYQSNVTIELFSLCHK